MYRHVTKTATGNTMPSTQGNTRRSILTGVHKRRLISAVDTRESPGSQSIKVESTSPWIVHDRVIVNQRRRSLTPRRRRARKINAPDGNERKSRATPRRKPKVPDDDVFLVYHSPRHVHETRVPCGSPKAESPGKLSRDREKLKRKFSRDALLQNVPLEYLDHIPHFTSDSDDDLHLSEESVQRTYKPATQKSQCDTNNLRASRMSKGPSDHLFDEFVSTNYEKVAKYLKPVSVNDSKNNEPPFKYMKRDPEPGRSSFASLGNGSLGYAEEMKPQETSTMKTSTRTKVERQPKPEKLPQRSRRSKTSSNRNQLEKTWTDTCDKYSFVDPVDYNFEKGGGNGGRMSLSEFRKACTQRKLESRETLKSPENHFEFSPNVVGNSETPKQSPRKSQKRILTVSSSNQSAASSPEIQVISPGQLRRIHRLRKFASRLRRSEALRKQKDAPIEQEELAPVASSSRVDRKSVKQSSEAARKVESKVQSRQSRKSQPNIKSIEMLKGAQLKRQRGGWSLSLEKQ